MERMPKPATMPRMSGPSGPPRKFADADRRDYTMTELREIARDHDLPARSRMTHDELVELITAADIILPSKPLERMPPYRRKSR
jgi:hypothetical protein